MNAIRRWPRPMRCSTASRVPRRLSTWTPGMRSSLVPCHIVDDRDVGVAQVGEEARLVAHVAEQEDPVALARLEDRRQLERLGRPGVGEAEDDVVAAGPGRARDRLDGTREERVGDVADDRPEEHRGRPSEGPRERVRSVLEVASRREDPLPGLLRDRHGQRRVVEDPRHGAPGHPGRDRDVLHRRRPGATAGSAGRAQAACVGRLIGRCRPPFVVRPISTRTVVGARRGSRRRPG